MSLVAHRFGRVEFWIFALIFSTAHASGKQQQIFEKLSNFLIERELMGDIL